MSLYNTYKHLLGLEYIPGDQDCYGLVRRYYQDVWDLPIANIARPTNWWHDPELNLICENLTEEWRQESTSLRTLQIGDGLIMSLICGRANHVGVYVGNGNFIHHVQGRFSCEEPLNQKWASRLLMVVRRAEITEAIKTRAEKVDIQTHFTNHAQRKFNSLV